MKKYFLYVLVVIWLLCGSGLTSLSAQSTATDTDVELWSYMMRQSQIWYENMIKQVGMVDPAEWKEPLESAFLR
jgi:hypothetical protein